MKAVFRTYRIPIAVTALMIAILIFWAWQTWHGISERSQEWHRRHAIGLFDAIENTMRSFGDEGLLRPGPIRSLLENIVRNTPVRFILLEKEGRPIYKVGEAPENLSLPAEEGEQFSEGRFLLWRKMRLENDAEGRGKEGETVFESISGMNAFGEPVMILGLEIRRDRGRAAREQQSLLINFGAALLCVTAGMIAWIMMIRSRLLAEQLKAEHTRRAHLEELGLAAAGLAHETKNPLGIILGIAQQMTARPDVPEKSRVMLEQIIDEVDKASARLGNFMTFARQRRIDAAAIEIKSLCKRVAEVLGPDFDAVGVGLEIEAAPMHIRADEEMLRQILVNLLLNSLHATPAGARVTVRTERTGTHAALIVEDRGSGIPPELLPDVFKPYVAGRSGGHGLGLAIVKRFVEEHGWRIAVGSDPGRGTRVTISGIRLEEEGTESPWPLSS